MPGAGPLVGMPARTGATGRFSEDARPLKPLLKTADGTLESSEGARGFEEEGKVPQELPTDWPVCCQGLFTDRLEFGF